MDATSTKKYLIGGRVQGVGYRNFAQKAARALRLRGWARNLDDGRVEVVAAGGKRQLERFEGELRLGPTFAQVRQFEVEDHVAEDVRIEGFHIR
jgi:acylphosphatase